MNALEQVARVRDAARTVRAWTPSTYTDVRAAMPQVVADHHGDPVDWAVTVALFQQPHETPTAAALRLARYMTMHAERWNTTPTLASLRDPRRSATW